MMSFPEFLLLCYFIKGMCDMIRWLFTRRPNRDELKIMLNGIIQCRKYLKNGKYDQVGGLPAIIYYHPDGINVREELFYSEGVLKTVDDSPIRKVYDVHHHLIIRIYNDQTEKHLRSKRPTVEFLSSQGVSEQSIWSYNGKIHRFNAPATIINGSATYVINGYVSNEHVGTFQKTDEKECVICMLSEEENADQNFVKTACNHIFHEHCLEEWLLHKDDCPVCRFSFVVDKSICQLINLNKKKILYLLFTNDTRKDSQNPFSNGECVQN